MNVIFYHRLPQPDENFSIERLFADVRASLPADITPIVSQCRFRSVGLWKRVYNVLEAALRQGDVNHITGDVHYLAVCLRRRKTVLSVMDCVLLERTRGIKWCLAFVLWYWLPARRSQLITVISESTKRELRRYLKFPEEKVRVVHCPVSDVFRFSPRASDFAKPIILQIGTKPNKNLERVAAAIHGISCHLRVIGRLGRQQEAALERWGVEYSAVANISGEDVVEEYRRCDMLVFASTYEGFGLPIVEAQATGRPVVTSNLLSMPEVSGDAACLVDPFDVQSIREGILKVIGDPLYRQELVQKGLVNAQRFRPETVAAQYAAIYRELYGDKVDTRSRQKVARAA